VQVAWSMHLGCCSTFGKRKNTLAYGSCIFTLSESLATSRVHGSRNPARKTSRYSFTPFKKINAIRSTQTQLLLIYSAAAVKYLYFGGFITNWKYLRRVSVIVGLFIGILRHDFSRYGILLFTYYIHDKITAIWLVKRSAIISLIALSRSAINDFRDGWGERSLLAAWNFQGGIIPVC
jgi:hypothetical protein